MKKIFISLMILAIMSGITVSTQAGMCNRINGLVYNDCTNINLLQECNYVDTTMTSQETFNWTDNLRNQEYNDYRHPAMLHQDSFGPASGFNIADSEVKRTNLTTTNSRAKSTSLSEHTTRLVLFMLLTGQTPTQP
jgi:hypothetical protein